MSGPIKKTVLTVCIASVHFAATMGSFYAAAWANTKPSPHLEQALSQTFALLSFPASLGYEKLYIEDASFAIYILVTAIGSMLWGLAFMPLIVALKHRVIRRSQLAKSSQPRRGAGRSSGNPRAAERRS